jgi:hypothetical protein
VQLRQISVTRLKHLQILLKECHLILPVAQFKEEALAEVLNIRRLAFRPDKLIEMLQTVLAYSLNVRLDQFS